MKHLSKKEVSIPTLNADDAITAITDEEKFSILNYNFSRCWNRFQPLPLSEYFMNDTEEVGDSSDLFCSMDEIMKLKHGLDVSKENGLDGVSARMLKATASSIAPSLTKLFNLSISAGQFPALWKSARVVSIPKSSSRGCNPLTTGQSHCCQYLASCLRSTSISSSENISMSTTHSLLRSGDFRRESPQY